MWYEHTAFCQTHNPKLLLQKQHLHMINKYTSSMLHVNKIHFTHCRRQGRGKLASKCTQYSVSPTSHFVFVLHARQPIDLLLRRSVYSLRGRRLSWRFMYTWSPFVHPFCLRARLYRTRYRFTARLVGHLRTAPRSRRASTSLMALR